MLAFTTTTKTCPMAEAINRHLTLVQRCKIEAYLSSGRSQRDIAQRLGVSPSTVSREIRRNGIAGVGYEARLAQLVAVKRRRDAAARPRKVTPRHLKTGLTTFKITSTACEQR